MVGSNRWLRGLGIVAVGACLALGAGHGVAAAEPDASSGGPGTAKSSQGGESAQAPTEPSATSAGNSEHDGTQPDSPDAKDPAKPTSTVSAATVTVEKEREAEELVDPPEEAADAQPIRDVEKSSKSTRAEAAPHVARPAVRAETVTTERDAPTKADVPDEVAGPLTPLSVPATPGPVVRDDSPPAAERADAIMAVAVTPAMVAPPQPNLINVIGTLLFTVLTLPLKLLEQTPVVPPGYSVTVGRSTLDIGCGCGQTVDARWYFPDADAHGGAAPKSVVYLQHGFIRSNSAMSAMAIELAERTNSVVVTPTLTSNPFTADGCWINGEPMQAAVANLFAGDRTALTDSAIAAGWTGGALPTKFVLAGHSAGGGLAAAAAGYTTGNGAVSDLLLVVMLDGVPTGDALPVALGKLTGDDARQVLQIASPPYSWNANGLGADQLTATRPGEFVGLQLVGGSHVDYEGASSDFLAQLACGFPRPENVKAAQTLAVTWINEAIAGSAIVAPGGPGQTITIPTTAGNATAVVLGAAAPAGLVNVGTSAAISA